MKIIGLVLLLAGLALIGGSLYYSYQIYTGKIQPPTVMQIENRVSVEIQQKGTGTLSQAELQKQVQTMIEDNIKQILPTELIQKSFNLIVFSIFATILIFAGTQVAGLGIKLMTS